MDDSTKTSVLFFDDSGASYTDNSAKAFDFSRDTFGLALASADFLYIGRRKPFHAVFVELGTANATTNEVSAEYYNGTAWTALTLDTEATDGFTRSGFIRWTVPMSGGVTLWEENAVNSTTKFWVRLSVDAGLDAGTTVKGLNIVFADDSDLKREDYGILALLPEDENEVAASSHILSHEAARDAIMDHIEREGKAKTDADDGTIKALDPYDLLDIKQIRLAAVYKALAKIYFAASDNQEDIYWAKHLKYEDLFARSMEKYILSLDANDDGITDTGERTTSAGSGVFVRG